MAKSLLDNLKENEPKKQITQNVNLGNPNSPWNKAVQTGNPNVQVKSATKKTTVQTPQQAQVQASQKVNNFLGSAIGTGVSQTLQGISNIAKSVPVATEAGAKAISNLADAPVKTMQSRLNPSEIEPKEDSFIKRFSDALFGYDEPVSTVEQPKTEQGIIKNKLQNIANNQAIAEGNEPVKQVTEWKDPWDNALNNNVQNVRSAGQAYTQAVTPVTDWVDNAAQNVTEFTDREFTANLNPTQQFVAQAVGNAIPNFTRQALLGAVSGGSIPLLNVLSDVAMFLPSFYQGYEEGKQNGLSDEEAYLNAIVRGGIEAGSEHLSDVWMVNGGQSMFDEYLLDKIAQSNMTPFAKFVGKQMLSGIGEATEEVAARLGNTLADRGVYGTNIDYGQLALGSLEDAGASFISTMVLGLLGGQYSSKAYNQFREYANSLNQDIENDENKTYAALVLASMDDAQRNQYLAQAQEDIRNKYGASDPIANMGEQEFRDWVERNVEKQIMGLSEEQYAHYIDRMNGTEMPVGRIRDGRNTVDVYEYYGNKTADQVKALEIADRFGVKAYIVDELPAGQNAQKADDGTIYISAKAKKPASTLIWHEMFHKFRDNGTWDDLKETAFNSMAGDVGFNNYMDNLLTRYVRYYGNINNDELRQISLSTDLSAEEKNQAKRDYLREQGVNQYYADENFRNKIDEEVAAEFMERMGNEDSIRAMFNRSGNVAEQIWQKLNDAVKSFTGVLTQEEQDLVNTEQLFAKVARENYEKARADIKVANDGSAYAMYSATTWNALGDEGKRRLAEEIAKQVGTTLDVAQKWINDINSVAAIIGADKDRLDYEPNKAYSALKNDSDYIYTVDMSTLCKKRILLSNTIEEIQRLMPNIVLTGDDYIHIRQMMKDKGYEVACGFCYVESRRKFLDTVAQEFIDVMTGKKTDPNNRQRMVTDELRNKDDYIPDLYELTTATGIEQLRSEHPDVYSTFVSFNNARGQNRVKLIETRTEYNGEILDISDTDFDKIQRHGGLRLQSYSDFETPHLIDMMQVVADMAARGFKSQAYTKVPNFADAFGRTGIKINESLVVQGVDENGKLIFDDIEGMPHEIAFALRQKYSDTVGTVIVGKDDATILAAMADPRIDYIIPFHASGWKQDEYEALGINGYKNYTNYQTEKDVVSGKTIKEQLYPGDYWDDNASGDENAKNYLRLCEEQGRIPKFSNFLTKDDEGHWVAPSGYWKTLIDFKMYDNDGNNAPQRVVTPTFEDSVTERILNEYEGDHNKYSPKMDIVNEFIQEKGYGDTMLSVDAPELDENSTDEEWNNAYFDAIDRGDKRETQRIRDRHAAVGGRYDPNNPLYHGTPRFGWTEYKDNQHEVPFIYTSNNPTVAAHYAGDNHYAFRRDLNWAYSGGSDIDSIIMDANSVWGTNYRVMGDADRQRVINDTIDGMQDVVNNVLELQSKVNDYTIPSTGDAEYDEKIQNALTQLESFIWDIDGYGNELRNLNEMDDYYRNEYRNYLIRDLAEYEEAHDVMREYFGEHRNELNEDLRNYIRYLISYDVSDQAIYADKIVRSLADGDMLINELGNISYPDKVRDDLDSIHNIGAYTFYGDRGDNPYYMDANGAQYYAMQDPNVSDTYTNTDAISKWASDKGYSSVIMDNIYDYGDKAQNNVFFDPSQIKLADAITYDDEGNIIPVTERDNPDSNDVRYSLDSDGNELTENQQNYFKDSKVRNADGNLRVMWHFTNANFDSFLPGTSPDPNGIKGIMFAPTDNGSISSRLGVGKPYYLNVTNPIVPNTTEGRPYAVKLREMQKGVTDREELARINRQFVEETGVDGFIDWMNGWYTVMTPEQIKSIDNLNPTDSPDYMYSLDVGDNHLYQYNSYSGDDLRPLIDGMMDRPQEGEDVNEWLTNRETKVKKTLKRLVDKSFRDIEKINLKNVKGSKAKIVNALYEAGTGGGDLDIHVIRRILEQNPVTATREMYPGESTARRRVDAASAFTEALMKNLGFDGFYQTEWDAVMARDSVGSPKRVTLEDYRDMVERGENLEERTQRLDQEDANQEYTDDDIQRQIIEDSMNLNSETPQQRDETVQAIAEAMQNEPVTDEIPEQANRYKVKDNPQGRAANIFLGKLSRERNAADPYTYESITPESFPVPDRIQEYMDLIQDEDDRKYGFDTVPENELSDEEKQMWQSLPANKSGALQGFATPTQMANNMFGKSGEQREFFREKFELPMYEQKKLYNAAREERWNALEDIIKETGIQANTEESAAVQWYGEGVKPNEQGETIPYTLDDLKREFPNKWEDIVKMERFMRNMYDEYVGRINAALEQVYPNLEEKAQAQLQSWRNKKQIYQDEISMSRNPSANEYWQNEINKLDAKIAKLEGDLESGEYFRNKRLNPRKDYFHHFQEVETKGIGGLKNILQASTLIDPELVGKSEHTKPKSRWMSWLQKRGQGAYTADAVLGMGKYIDSAEYAIAFDPLIAQYRDEISKMVRATKETKNANQLIQYMSGYTNQLAGKTPSLDRTILDLLGEGNRGQLFNALAAINNRAKSNAVIGNIRSAVAQVFNIPNAMSIIKSNNAWAKGAQDYLNSKLGNRELLDQSPFLQERYFDHNVDDLKARNTTWEKITGKLGDITNKMMEIGDKEATELIWLAAYNEGLEKNVSDPIYYADDLTRQSVAGRGVGEVPYNMKSKVASFFMPFQVETNNAWQNLKGMLKDKDANGVFRLMLASYLMNAMVKPLFNDGVVPDVLGVLIDGIKDLFDKDREESVGEVALNTGKRMAGEAISYIPGTSLWLPAIMSDDSAEALFGESDPTRYGTGTVGLSTITDTMADAVNGGGFDLMTPLLQMGLPYGGRQASRLYNTLQDFNVLPSNGIMNTPIGGERNPVNGDYSKAGALKYQLPDEVNSADDVFEIARAFAFGSNSTNAAREYYDSGKAALSKEKVQNLRDHPEVNPKTYMSYLNEANTDGKSGITQQEAYDWISTHNLSDEEANALWELTNSGWKKSYDEYQPKETNETKEESDKAEKKSTEKTETNKSGTPTTKKELTAVADSDGNGSLKQSEAYDWLNSQKLSEEEKAALWELMGWKTDYESYKAKHQ